MTRPITQQRKDNTLTRMLVSGFLCIAGCIMALIFLHHGYDQVALFCGFHALGFLLIMNDTD